MVPGGGAGGEESGDPLARAALYAQGEDLHVAVWPGGLHNTEKITPFVAREARAFVLSVSGLMGRADVADVPHRDLILEAFPDVLANGGSCLAGPDGRWVIAPCVGKEMLLVATIDHGRVREERQNFDPAGHYARPDVTRLTLDRRRQSTLTIIDAPDD